MSKGKTLYSTQNISEFMKGKSGVVEVDSNIIFTSSAMDIMRTKGISIVYKKDGVACCSGDDVSSNVYNDEDIIKNITKILINKFNITDEKIIKNVIMEVLNRIK